MSEDFWAVTEVNIIDESEVVVDQTTLADVTVEMTPQYITVESAPVVGSSTAAPQLPQQVITELVSSTEAYIGYADPSALTSDAAWHICHVVDSPSGVRTTWAYSGSGSLLDRVWDSRLTYTYG
jgi:hypothetical protein